MSSIASAPGAATAGQIGSVDRSGLGSDFATDLLAGLSASPKRLPPKHFYDAAGSRLFERITDSAGILSDAHGASHPGGSRRRDRGVHPEWRRARRVRQRIQHQGAPAARQAAAPGRLRSRRHLGRVPGRRGGKARRRVSAPQHRSDRRGFHARLRAAARPRQASARGLLPGLDDRQFRARSRTGASCTSPGGFSARGPSSSSASTSSRTAASSSRPTMMPRG